MNNKIFNLGLGRTGTKSFHSLMLDLNFTSIHEPNDGIISWMFGESKGGIFFNDSKKNVDSFSGGITHRYRDIYEIYPDAKYVLTTRSAESWLESRLRLHSKEQSSGRDNPRWAHVCDDPLFGRLIKFGSVVDGIQRRLLIQKFNEIHKEIRNFFKDKENFIEMNFIDSDKEKAMKELLEFLGIEFKNIEFPHNNQRDCISPDGLHSTDEPERDRC